MVTERRTKLLEIVRRQGFASLPDLAETLDVSESTVRRDLDYLEKTGMARRTHGGAFYAGPKPQLAHFQSRQEAQWGKKRAIARVAASLIGGVDTLLLDGGSTTYELARLMTGTPMQVVTNSLPVANLFSSRPEVGLIVVGGYLQSTSGVLLGTYAEQMLSSLRVRTAVISAAGVTDTGLYNSNHMTATTQQAMIRAADQVILVADSTKFGHQSIAKVCDLHEIDHVVVDSQVEESWQKTITSAGVQLSLADELAADSHPVTDGRAATQADSSL
ncbi:DeoR/GlpR family DNA-binding transcription regulator [Aeoliella mucimassa]|uniref:Glycerol-3-phosphate regulon repressor n=1 Tax=Aeoliella mucimassa TaxID=2527972 RepID=A0A518APY5_9BACT|nr:DeoR/GlpR family DNA-binding transcription regulator [Aeoliella mucimassa]QDU56777.1 Glycerol-3-phosphate regulon repressor [Aeoliella mucimassa]